MVFYICVAMITNGATPRRGEWPDASGPFCVTLAPFPSYWYPANQIQYDAGRQYMIGDVNVDTGMR